MGCCSTNRNKNKNTSIHAQMTIEEILSMFPHKSQKLLQEITNAGLHCVGCHAATWETLEAGMLNHGKDPQEIETLVNRLNTLLREEVDHSTISLTPKAASKFLEILAEEGKEGWGMRYDEQRGGCNGFEYVLDFSEKASENDRIFSSYGVDIHVREECLERLLGSEIDYVDGLKSSGFKITNPNTRSSCGCSNSHGY